jgi:threonine aldolase
MAAVKAVAARAGLPVHLDGARLLNAAAYLDVLLSDICRHVDSVWFALCKGLGGPVGALLAGDAAFMTEARRAAKMLGGGMRQAGLIAAPAIVALRDPYPLLKRDHELARKLARGLAAIDSSLVDVERVQTNIVNCYVDGFAADAAPIVRGLRERGILANSKRAKIRFVTHYHIDEAAVAAAVQAVAEVVASLRKAA